MKVILTMAISANGIIATKDGDESFLSHDNWMQFVKLANQVGCFIWGRKTYEAVLSWEGNYLSELKSVKKIVISGSELELREGFLLAHSPEEALELLDKEGQTEAIITGGSTVNSAFAKKNLIDEVIFDVNPVILGEGIPVFNPEEFSMELTLLKMRKLNDNLLELHYKVIK